MGKRLVITATLLLGSLLFFSSSSLSGEITKVRISEAAEMECLLPVNSEWGETDVTSQIQPYPISSSPGYQVGTTHYDYQTSGPTGNRVVKDALDGIHACWMNGIDEWIGNRWIYYNFRDASSGTWKWESWGTQVNYDEGAGYTNMDVFSDGRAAITYHSVGNVKYTVVAVDISPGFGAFSEYNVPDSIAGDSALWPYVAVDREDRIHITAHGHWTYQLMYSRSQDEGCTWTNPVIIDTLDGCECGIVVASSVDDRVAIVYADETVDPDVYNDIYYVESPDGITWDWTHKVNVTGYYTNPAVDSTVAYFDIDAVYDNDANLHIVWVGTHRSSTQGWLIHSYLMHWSEATGITEIAEHPQWEFPDCRTGSWNLSFAKLSIGCDSENNLFVIATRFDNQDCSAGGYANGEIYGCASNNGGATWGEVVNLTNSPTPDCWPMECDSDHWSSLAETVDDSLYILYINDKDAGGIPQWEGTDTENPVMYYAVHKSVLLPTGLDDAEEAKPTSFALKQNYPNPFNASTEISYQLPRPGRITLEVFNLLGQRIETLVDEHQTPGDKSVIWDASRFSSGIYFCRLTAGDLTQVRRITLLR